MQKMILLRQPIRYFLAMTFCTLLLAYAPNLASAQFRDSAKQDKRTVDTSGFHMRRSPALALVLSGILPGAGQVYTGGWYKAPLFLGGIVACLYAAHIQNGRYLVDVDSVNSQPARNDQQTTNLYIQAREFYRDDRDKWYIYAGLFYLANLIDAYISAHLFDFDVSDPNATTSIEPPKTRNEPWRLAVSYRF
jgi:hypothetical protein